jgi:hypothetical protein
VYRLEELFVRAYLNDELIGETRACRSVPALISVPTHTQKKSVSDWIYYKHTPQLSKHTHATSTTGKQTTTAKPSNKLLSAITNTPMGEMSAHTPFVGCVPRGRLLEQNTLTLEIVHKPSSASSISADTHGADDEQDAYAHTSTHTSTHTNTQASREPCTVLVSKTFSNRELTSVLERSAGDRVQTVTLEIEFPGVHTDTYTGTPTGTHTPDNNDTRSVNTQTNNASKGGDRRKDSSESARSAMTGKSAHTQHTQPTIQSSKHTQPQQQLSSKQTPPQAPTQQPIASESSVRCELSFVCDYEVMDEWEIVDKHRRHVSVSVHTLKDVFVPKDVVQTYKHRTGLRHCDINEQTLATQAVSTQQTQKKRFRYSDEMYLSVCWNNQIVYRSKYLPFDRHAQTQRTNNDGGDANTQESMLMSVDTHIDMHVPLGRRLRDCVLEVSVWCGHTRVSQVLMNRSQLVNFFVNSMKQQQQQATEHAQAHTQVDDDLSASSSIVQFEWLPLMSARTQSQARADIDFMQTDNVQQLNQQQEQLGFVQLAGTAHAYLLQLEEEQPAALDATTRTDTMQLTNTNTNTQTPTHTAAALPPSSIMDKRRARIHYVPLSVVSSDLRHRQLHWEKVFAPSTSTTTKASKKQSLVAIESKLTPKPSPTTAIVRLIRVEYAHANPHKRHSKVKETDRVTWRGRVVPKQMILTGGATMKSMTNILQRTAKLYRHQSIVQMKVLPEVFQLRVDDDGLGRNKDGTELPIIVKEGLSNSPGLVTGMYRIEVIGNRNMALGFAEIANDHELQLVAGKDARDLFPGADRDKWDMGAIFEYIVRERLILEMLPTMRSSSRINPSGKKAGRRAAVSLQVSEHHGGSNVTLMRDTEDEVFPKDRQIMDLDAGSISEGSSTVKKTFWIRIAARTHKIAGNLMRTFVFLEGHSPVMQGTPDKYFLKLSATDALRELNVIIRCADKKLGIHSEISMTGIDLLRWLPEQFPVNLRSKFKRRLLGNVVIEGICLHYDSQHGKYKIDLANTELLRKMMSDGRGLTDLSGLSGINRRTRIFNDNDEIVENEEDELDQEDDDEEDDDVFGRVTDMATNMASNIASGIGDVASDVMGKLSSLFGSGSGTSSRAATADHTAAAGSSRPQSSGNNESQTSTFGAFSSKFFRSASAAPGDS